MELNKINNNIFYDRNFKFVLPKLMNKSFYAMLTYKKLNY